MLCGFFQAAWKHFSNKNDRKNGRFFVRLKQFQAAWKYFIIDNCIESTYNSYLSNINKTNQLLIVNSN